MSTHCLRLGHSMCGSMLCVRFALHHQPTQQGARSLRRCFYNFFKKRLDKYSARWYIMLIPWASVTQLVEYHVANVTVAGSNPVTRSILIETGTLQHSKVPFLLPASSFSPNAFCEFYNDNFQNQLDKLLLRGYILHILASPSSRGLGHRVLIPATWVRIPLEMPFFCLFSKNRE